MRVDLHCHTKKTKKGDGPKRNVTPELFAEKIEEMQIKIVAITNHNVFDRDQYDVLSNAVEDIAQVWPGVEFDVTRGEGSHWHMLIIAGPKQLDLFSEAVSNVMKDQSPNDCLLDFDAIWTAFCDLDVLFVSHCHDKDPFITEADMEHISSVTHNDWRFYFEPRTLVTLGIWSNHGRSMLMGSDVKNWDKYGEKEPVSLRLPVSSFEQFFLLAKRDKTVIETLLNGCSTQIMSVSPHSDVRFELPFFKDINIIFGQKGTGKTEIMRSLRTQYAALGIPCSNYFGGEKNDEYNKLLDLSSVPRLPDEFGRADGKEIIADMKQWRDATPTLLEKYIDWVSTKGNSSKKDAFKLSEWQELPEKMHDVYDELKQEDTIIASFEERASSHDLYRYLTENEAATFAELMRKIKRAIRETKRSEYIDIESTRLTNKALVSLKGEIDKKSDTQSKPSKAGFAEYVNRRIELWKSTKRLLSLIEPDERLDEQYLGELEKKGKLYLVTRRRYLTDESRTSEFLTGITKLREWKRAAEQIVEKTLDYDLPAAVSAFIEISNESAIEDTSSFIGVSKYVVRGNPRKDYDPSDGEKGILIIERALREEADVYLLDEPELGMSNLYIDSIIRPLIENLAKNRKTVIISTHNANLAVRTLPYQSIYREHVSGDDFRTYVGNPFVDMLVDREGVADPIKWTDTSISTLEGGEDAFYDRLTIYEAGNHDN